MKKQKVFFTLLISCFIFLFGINIVNAASPGEITLSKSASKDNLVYGRTADVTLGITANSFTDPTDIVLVLDRSTSMNDDENTTIAPMIEAKNAAKELVDTIIKSNPEGVRVAVVTYGYDYLSSYSCGFTNSLTKLKNTISSIPDEYETKGTNLYAGLKQADSLLKESSAKNKFVVLLSDGVPTRYNGTKSLCNNNNLDECGQTIKIDDKNVKGIIPVTKAEGALVKKHGAVVYTVAFNFDKLTEKNQSIATEVVNYVSSGKNYRFSASGYSGLKIAFQNIAKELTTVATGVVEDIVPNGFKIVENSLNATNGTVSTKVEDGKTVIVWNVGNISSSENPRLTYKLEAEPNHYGSMYTNESAILNVDPVDGNPTYKEDTTLEFPMPVVPIPSVTKDDDYGTIKQGESKTVTLDNDILNNDELVYPHVDKNASVVNKIVLVYDNETNGNKDDLKIDLSDGTFTYTSNENTLGQITYKYYVESYVTIDGNTTKVRSNTSKITINVEKYPTKYTVNYLENKTNIVLHEAKLGTGYAFESVTENAIDIDGYVKLPEIEQNLTLKQAAEENVINFYYEKRNDLSYIVNYLEKDTNEVLHEPKIADNQTFGTEIKSSDEVIEIDGYYYDSVDKEVLTISTGENVINIYYTKRADLGYRVNYLEKDSNIVLHDAKKVENQKFGQVITAKDEIIDIDSYKYDSTDKETLTITTGDNVINIYYIKRADLNYIVNYLEKDTNEVLHDQKIVDNQTFGTEIKASDEVIDIAGYKYDSVDKDVLTITTAENIINIYYVKKIGTVRAIYVDTKGNPLAEPIEMSGMVTTEYKTTAKVIPDYELFKIEGNETGVFTEEPIEVVYIYQYVMGEGGVDISNIPPKPTPIVKTGHIESNTAELLLGASTILLGALIVFRKKFM